MIRRPPRSTQGVSSAASDVYKRQPLHHSQEKIIKKLPPCGEPCPEIEYITWHELLADPGAVAVLPRYYFASKYREVLSQSPLLSCRARFKTLQAASRDILYSGGMAQWSGYRCAARTQTSTTPCLRGAPAPLASPGPLPRARFHRCSAHVVTLLFLSLIHISEPTRPY